MRVMGGCGILLGRRVSDFRKCPRERDLFAAGSPAIEATINLTGTAAIFGDVPADRVSVS